MDLLQSYVNWTQHLLVLLSIFWSLYTVEEVTTSHILKGTSERVGGVRSPRSSSDEQDNFSDIEVCTLDYRTCPDPEVLPARGRFGETYTACFCDERCQLYGDCCEIQSPGTNDSTWDDDLKEAYQQSQHSSPSVLVEYSSCSYRLDWSLLFYIVDKCPQGHPLGDIRQNCENPSEDWLLKVPVSDTKLGFTFVNIFCAICHGFHKSDIEYWSVDIECLETGWGFGDYMSSWEYVSLDPPDPSGPSEAPEPTPGVSDYNSRMHEDESSEIATILDTYDCSIRHRHYDLTVNPRECVKAIKTCDPKWPHDDTYSDCHNGSTIYVRESRTVRIYRNPSCAQCNSVHSPVCHNERFSPFSSSPGASSTSIRILLDLNTGINMIDEEEQHAESNCDVNHIYDVIKQTCRLVTCGPGYVLQNQECHRLNYTGDNSSQALQQCPKIGLEEDEYAFLDNGTIFLNASHTVLEIDEIMMINETVYICIDHLPNYTWGGPYDLNEIVEAWTSLTGQILSIIALSVLIVTYIVFKELRTLPGRCLLCLSASLAIAQSLFLIGIFARKSFYFCKTIGILTHYSFLVSFAWMNVMSFDIWRTFHQHFIIYDSTVKSRLFFKYCIYCHLIPAIITMVSVIINEMGDESLPRAQYGLKLCWINDTRPLLMFFALPGFICIVVNTIFFVFAVYHLRKAFVNNILQKQQLSGRRKRVILYIKLSTVMGLTWVFGFLAALTGHSALWLLFVLFNSLQGLSICIAFLCNRKVARLVCKKIAFIQLDSRSRSEAAPSTKETPVSTDKPQETRL